MPDAVAAVILAAGAGTRLGGVAKALLPAPGGSFLHAIAAVLAEVGVAPARTVVVVAAPHGDRVAAEAARLGLSVVVNPAPGSEMSSSVACGFAAVVDDVRFSDAGVALLWPVDHARVGAGAVRAVLAAAGDGAAVPTWHGRGGHPVAVARRLWPALAALTATAAPDGARGVLRPVARRIEVADAGVVADVDTWADLDAGRDVGSSR